MHRAWFVPIVYRWAITLVFATIVVVLSITPGLPESGDSVFNWLVVTTPTLLQKLMHVTIYAVLASLLMWSLEKVASRAARLSLALFVAICLGAGLELYQTQVPGRFGSIFDIALNSLGAVVGAFAALFLF